MPLNEVLYTGFYPRIFDNHLNPTDAMGFYVNTYVERDLRMMINVRDLSKFEIFLKLCAGRTGQILNLTSLGNDCGVDQRTIKSWISVLEASFIVKRLRPYYRNFNKRLIKSPKLYFLDTGLICFLLDIRNPGQLATHPLRGAIFESYVVSEILKHRFNRGRNDHLFYFRDNTGNEVDLICDYGLTLTPIEIKSGQTITSDFLKGLRYIAKLTENIKNASIIYGGDDSYLRQGVQIMSWRNIELMGDSPPA